MAYPPVLSRSSISGKASFAVRPKGMVWANDDGLLVPNGDETAAVKVSNGVETMPLHEVQKYPNYRDHFEPVNANDFFPPADDPEEKEAQEAAIPVAKRGKKAPVVNPAA